MCYYTFVRYLCGCRPPNPVLLICGQRRINRGLCENPPTTEHEKRLSYNCDDCQSSYITDERILGEQGSTIHQSQSRPRAERERAPPPEPRSVRRAPSRRRPERERALSPDSAEAARLRERVRQWEREEEEERQRVARRAREEEERRRVARRDGHGRR